MVTLSHNIPLFRLGIVLLIAAVWMVPAPADATLMRYADTERLVELSDAIVHATVIDRRSYLDAKRTPRTKTTVEVHHSFLGTDSKTIAFEQWGGDHGSRIGRIPGDPHLEIGQEVVLFLSDDGDGNFTLAALSQAVFEVRRKDDRVFAHRDLSELSFLVTDDNGSRIIDHRDPSHEWSTFKEIVDRYVDIRGDRK